MKGSPAISKFLLASGTIAALWYTVVNLVVPCYYPGYDPVSQTVSELSAIGVPTRNIWVLMGSLYTILVFMFSVGIILSAGTNRMLRIVGFLLLAQALINIYWPPMHQREVLAAGGGTLTDTLHIVYTFATVILMMAMIIIGAATLKGWFRVYSIITLILFLVFGILSGIDGPKLDKGLPTPLLGVWERINIGLFIAWMLVLSLVLLRREKHKSLPEVPSSREN